MKKVEKHRDLQSGAVCAPAPHRASRSARSARWRRKSGSSSIFLLPFSTTPASTTCDKSAPNVDMHPTAHSPPLRSAANAPF